MREDTLEIQKTLHDKAREKFKESVKKSDEEVNKEQIASDILYPYLEKRGKHKEKNLVLDHSEAQAIKNEVMKKLKDRLLSRAEIIQKRLEEERYNLELAEQAHQRK